MNPAEATLLARTSNSAHRASIQNLFSLSGRLSNEKARLAKDTNLSDVGRREKEAQLAISLTKHFAEIVRPLKRARADVAKRKNFELPPVGKTDLIGEMKRQEVRSFLRGLPLDGRLNALDTLDDDATLAVIDVGAALSALPQDRHEFVKARFIEKKFGEQIRAIEAADDELEAVAAAAAIARRELQIASGLGGADFEKLEASHGN